MPGWEKRGLIFWPPKLPVPFLLISRRPKAAETLRLTFRGVLTEKYARYEREETHAENETSYVLVTPKVIPLRSGDLVTVQEGPAKGVYHVAVCHVLDAWKNEYEIVWRGDV